jgi:predicted RNA binding protein YcfA (HicA-like mRNA interferase family)
LGDRGTPRLTADQVISILRRNGFALAGSFGSHQKWRNVSTAKQVIVPYYRATSPSTMKAIVEEAG